MKKLLIAALLLVAIFFVRCAYIDSSVDTQGATESSLHELEGADQCSVITMNIRQLVSSLNETKREMSSLGAPVRSASENNELYEQQMNEYEQKMKVLKEMTVNIQKQIDTKEQQLELCLQGESISRK